MSNRYSQAEFINTLYQKCDGEEMVEIRTIHEEKGLSRPTFFKKFMTRKIEAYAKKMNSENHIFFGVATRDGQGGKKDNLVSIPAVWTEIDYKNHSNDQNVEKVLANLPIDPSITVFSGGGLHLYWLLDTPATKDQIPEIEDINRRLIQATGGVEDKIHDASRIMRLPGTNNIKLEYGDPIQANVKELNKDRLYSLDQLKEALPEVEKVYSESGAVLCPNGLVLYDPRFDLERYINSRNNETFRVIAGWIGKGLDEQTTWMLANAFYSTLPQEVFDAKPDDPFTLEEVKQIYDHAWREYSTDENNQPKTLYQRLDEYFKEMAADTVFTTRDVYVEIGTQGNKEKASIRKYIQDKTKAGIFERVGTKNGVYRKKDLAGIEEMDLDDIKAKPIDIWLPFEITDELLNVYAGNVIVVAGESNAGKTAFLLNIVKNNMDKHDVWYFNSEMGRIEFRERLDLFEDVEYKDWNFHKVARRRNYKDVIQPDAINIVDFLEPKGDEMMLVADEISDMWERLNDGIIIVAIQKDPFKPYGNGGAGTLNRSRLYINLKKGNWAEIVKGKGVRRDKGVDNVDGMMCRYKCVNGGYKLYRHTKWTRDTKYLKEMDPFSPAFAE